MFISRGETSINNHAERQNQYFVCFVLFFVLFFGSHGKFLLGCVRCFVLFQSTNLTNSDVCMTASDTSTYTNFGRTSTKRLNQAAEERLLNY